MSAKANTGVVIQHILSFSKAFRASGVKVTASDFSLLASPSKIVVQRFSDTSVVLNEPPEKSGHSEKTPYFCVVGRWSHLCNSFPVEVAGLHAVGVDFVT